MKCLDCEGKTWVEVTKPLPNEISRTRKCRKCGFKFKTIEWVDLTGLPKHILDKLES